MRDLEIRNGRLYFTSGNVTYALTPVGYSGFMVERTDGGVLISDDKAEKMEKKLKKL